MVKLVVTDREGGIVDVDATPGISLMENIRELDASVDAICGGMCACATCHVYIDAQWAAVAGARSYEETVMLEDVAGFDPQRSRLSCQIRITPELEGISLTVAPED